MDYFLIVVIELGCVFVGYVVVHLIYAYMHGVHETLYTKVFGFIYTLIAFNVIGHGAIYFVAHFFL
jgi:hypothetical protein